MDSCGTHSTDHFAESHYRASCMHGSETRGVLTYEAALMVDHDLVRRRQFNLDDRWNFLQRARLVLGLAMEVREEII